MAKCLIKYVFISRQNNFKVSDDMIFIRASVRRPPVHFVNLVSM